MSNFLQTLDKNLKTFFNKESVFYPTPTGEPIPSNTPPVLKTITQNLPKIQSRREPTEAEKKLAQYSGKDIIKDVAKLAPLAGRYLITRPIRMVAQSFQDVGGYLGDKEYTPEAYVPRTPVEKALFGEEPIDSAVTWKKRQDKQVADLGAGENGYNKTLLTTLGFMASFAPLGDILPGGKGKEKVLEKIIQGPLDEIIEAGMKSINDVDSFKILRNHVSEEIARKDAPLLTATKTKKEAENVLRDSVSRELQIVQNDTTLRIKELSTKQKQAPLSADEFDELKFLKQNKDKPEAIILANKVAESKDTIKTAPEKIKTPDSSLVLDPKKYNNADEFINSQDVDNDPLGVYNKIYGKNQPIGSKTITQGSEVGGLDGAGAVGNISKNSQPDFTGLAKFVNENPQGFTININGKPASKGFVVSPFKGRETILEKIDATSIRDFISKNIDLLQQEGNHFGGWKNTADGKFYLDISIVKDKLDDAFHIGAQNNQIAIYDLIKGEDVLTKDILKSKLKDIYNNAGKERKYITSAKASEDIASDISHEISETYNKKSNEGLIQRSIQRVDEDFEAAKKFATENSTDEAVATRVAVDKELSGRYVSATTEAEKQALAVELKDSIISHARLATEEGRTVQANALLGKQTPEGMLRTTSKMIDKYNLTAGTKVPQIDEKIVKKVLDASDEIAKMPEGLPKQVASKKLVDDLESLIPSPVWKKIVNVWKAGLLTGVKTSGVNIQSSFFNGVAEIVKDLPATGIDMAASLFTGQRTKVFTLRGLSQGGMEGVKKGWNYLRTGVSEQKATSSLEFSNIHFNSKPGKVLEVYTNTVYQIIGAEDMPFFYGAMRRSLAEQSLVTIKNQKKVFANSTERSKFIQNFIDNPPEDAMQLADLDAKIATFRNDTELGKMAQAIQGAPLLGPVAQMTVLPFAKTPSAVATAMFNYAPTGVISTFYKSFKGGQFNQKEFAEGLGRVVTGAGALWLGSQLLKDDLISLGYPKEAKERAEWEAIGKLPNSLKIGDTWYPLIQLGPIGGVIGIGGYVEKGKEETGSITGGVVTGLFGGIKGLTEQTFLTGVKNLLDVVEEPERKGELYAGRVLGSVIPTILSDFSQSFDDYQRKSNDFLDPLKARIPELRETLRPKIDVWGQRLERNRSAVSTAINPIRLSNTIQGKFNTEVERLEMSGEDVRPTKLDAKIKDVKLDNEEYYIFQRMYGEIIGIGLSALIDNKEYQTLPPDEQAKMFQDSIRDIKKGVGEIMLPIIIQKRYDLPKDIDAGLATDLVNQLSKISDEFNRSSVSKQRKLILKLLEGN